MFQWHEYRSGFQAGRDADIYILLTPSGRPILTALVRQQDRRQHTNVAELGDVVAVGDERPSSGKHPGDAVLVAGRMAGFVLQLLQAWHRRSSSEQQSSRASSEGPGTLDCNGSPRRSRRISRWSATASALAIAPAFAGTVEKARASSSPPSPLAERSSSDSAEHQGRSINGS